MALPPEDTRFKPGQSGNPGGKPRGSRNRLTTKFLFELCADFEAHGAQAIIDARTSDPLGYVKLVGSLLPKQVEQVQPLEEIHDADIAAAIAILQAARAAEDVAAGTESARVPSQTH